MASNIKLETVELQEVDEIKTAYDLFKAGKLDAMSAQGDYIGKMTEELER